MLSILSIPDDVNEDKVSISLISDDVTDEVSMLLILIDADEVSILVNEAVSVGIDGTDCIGGCCATAITRTHSKHINSINVDERNLV